MPAQHQQQQQRPIFLDHRNTVWPVLRNAERYVIVSNGGERIAIGCKQCLLVSHNYNDVAEQVLRPLPRISRPPGGALMLTPAIARNAIKHLAKKSPASAAEFRDALVNLFPTEHADVVLRSSVLDVLKVLTVGDVIEIVERFEKYEEEFLRRQTEAIE
jgi:hypothetical protein